MNKNTISKQLFDGTIVNFVYDESIPVSFVYWDTVETYKRYQTFKTVTNSKDVFNFDVFYNIPLEFFIKDINDNVEHIYKSYIIENNNNSNVFKTYPKAETSLPTWASFNPEKKMYSFDHSLFFNITVDTSKVSQCAYATKPYGLSQVSDYYQYANFSKNCVCSNPVFAKNDSISKCAYAFDALAIKTCSGYLEDKKTLFVNLLTHKTSKNCFELKTTVYRNIEDAYKIEIFNTNSNVIVSNLDYKLTVFEKNKKNLYEEARNYLIELLKVYEEDYNIEWKEDYLVSKVSFVSVQTKNNYISNLIPKDSYDNRRNKLPQTV